MDKFLLIEKVREHEVLYNDKSPEYRNHHVRQAAWEEIGRELQIPGNKAKECWDKLRRCLCNARNRRRGMAGKNKSLWTYEQQMSFIIPFIEDRRSHESQASVNLATELEDLSEEFEAKEHIPCQSKEGQADIESEKYTQGNQTTDDETALNNVETVEKTVYETVKHLRNKNQKQPINTTAHQMVQIVKEGTASRKHQYEEKSICPKQFKTTILQTLDDTDMFFLSMSRMTKQLPKIEQAQIKLALSNSVLSAEIRCMDVRRCGRSAKQK